MGTPESERVQWGGRLWLLALIAVVLTGAILLVLYPRSMAYKAPAPTAVPWTERPGVFLVIPTPVTPSPTPVPPTPTPPPTQAPVPTPTLQPTLAITATPVITTTPAISTTPAITTTPVLSPTGTPKP